MSPAVERAVEERTVSLVTVIDPAGSIKTNTGVYAGVDAVTKDELDARISGMFTAEDYRKGLINAREEEILRSDTHNYCMRKISHLARSFSEGDNCVVCEDQPEGCQSYRCSSCEHFVCTECFPQSMARRLVDDENGMDLHYVCPFCRGVFMAISRSRGTTMTSAPPLN